MQRLASFCVAMGGNGPSEASERVLKMTHAMLAGNDYDALIDKAAVIHNLCQEINPDVGPCDHLVDMLASCTSAKRFGLEKPCYSRHAADAAGHVLSTDTAYRSLTASLLAGKRNGRRLNSKRKLF